MATSKVRLLDIPWEQVLCKHFLPCFTLKEIFHLRSVSSEFRDLVDCYFSLAFTVNTTSCSSLLSRVAFNVITRNNCFLKELVLCNARDWLSDDVLIPILQNCPNLHTVDLSNCLSLSDTSIYTLGTHCRKVQSLSLRGCVWLSGAGLISLVINKLPLDYVDLCGCWDLKDDDVVNLAMVCRDMRYVLLNNIYGLTNRSVAQLAHFCPGLVQLSVQGCWRITDQALQLVSEYCPNLRALQVRDCPKVTEMSLSRLRARKVRIDKAPPPANARHWMSRDYRPLNVQI